MPETTFYRNSAYIWRAAELVFNEYQKFLVSELLQLKEDLIISFDGSWHKRFGFCSSLGMVLQMILQFVVYLVGRFCVYVFNLKKILFGCIRNKGRTRLSQNNTEEEIYLPYSHYDGSSKGIHLNHNFCSYDYRNGS